MLISYDWLHEYLPVKLGVEELSEILTGIGLEVEDMESRRSQIPYLQQVEIGHVDSLRKHENADKLRIAEVNVGDEILTIVCGAPNIAEGQQVVVAKVGAKLKSIKGDIFDIKKAKIRGQESSGMICSQAELGISDDASGIWILPEDAPIGQPLVDYLNLENADTVYTIGITPNRTDAMSHLGVARNVCAYLSFHRQKDIKAITPDTALPNSIQHTDPIKIEIDNSQACPRYMGILLSDIQVLPSPEWLQARLRSVGVKPINNIVDVTNFVLKECGQPLHAFDRDAIIGDSVIVKTLPEGTPFVALDGKTYSLSSQDLMICNDEGPMCMAGIYGGLHSGVKDTTTSIFIESAYFDSTYIRRSSMHHNLRTDAAQRYEKGVDISLLRYALQRAVSLIKVMTEARISSAIEDVYPQTIKRNEIKFKIENINSLIGKTYHAADIERLLKALDFEIVDRTSEQMHVIVPYALHDVSSTADIAEEILRIDGLNNVQTSDELKSVPSSGKDFEKQDFKKKIKHFLAAQGLREVLNNSISNEQYYQADYGDTMVHMLNSLNSELNVMRPNMIHSGLEDIAYNLNRQQNRLRFFEMGKIYAQVEPGQYTETEKVALWFTGSWDANNWLQKSIPTDIFTIKGLMNDLLSQVGITQWHNQEVNLPYLSRTYSYSVNSQPLGYIGKINENVLTQMDIKQDVWYMELDLMTMYNNRKTTVQYRPVNKYPSMKRDLSIVINKSVSYQDIQNEITQLNLTNLKEFSVFDIFQNDKLGDNNHSIGLTFVFENDKHTLNVEEVDAEISRVTTALNNKFGANLRN